MRAGLLEAEEDYASPTAPILCPRCKTFNSPDTKFCRICSLILDQSVADEMEAMATDVTNAPAALQRLIDERIAARMGEGGEI